MLVTKMGINSTASFHWFTRLACSRHISKTVS